MTKTKKVKGLDVHECDQCQRLKTDTKMRIDPYLLDMYNTKKEMLLCDLCTQIRAGG